MGIGIEVSVSEEGDIHVVVIEGRIDATTTPILEKKLQGLLKASSKILIDCSNIHYLSSAGMRLFLSITKRMHAKEGKVVFFGMNEDVMEIIKMAGFERALKIYNTKKEALKSVYKVR